MDPIVYSLENGVALPDLVAEAAAQACEEREAQREAA